MSQTLSSLARLTLRQLRQIASDLGVPLYSRKSKETLVDEVAQRQQKRGGDLKAIEAELNAPAMGSSDTRVVFLPRDPQWAYVFWEISDEDRKVAFAVPSRRLDARAPAAEEVEGRGVELHREGDHAVVLRRLLLVRRRLVQRQPARAH